MWADIDHGYCRSKRRTLSKSDYKEFVFLPLLQRNKNNNNTTISDYPSSENKSLFRMSKANPSDDKLPNQNKKDSAYFSPEYLEEKNGEEEKEDEKEKINNNDELICVLERRSVETEYMGMTEFFEDDPLPESLRSLQTTQPAVIAHLNRKHNVEYRVRQLHVYGRLKVKQLAQFENYATISMPIIDEEVAEGHIIMPISLRILQSYNKTLPYSLEWKFQNVVLPFIAPAPQTCTYTDKDLLPKPENPVSKADEIASTVQQAADHQDFSMRVVLDGAVDMGRIGGRYHEMLKDIIFIRIPSTHPYYHQLRMVSEEILNPRTQDTIIPSTVITHTGMYWNSGADVRKWRRDEHVCSLLLDMVDPVEGWKTAGLLIQLASRLIEERLKKQFAPFRTQISERSAQLPPTLEESTHYSVTVRRYDGGKFADLRMQSLHTFSPDAEIEFGVYFTLFYTLMAWPSSIEEPQLRQPTRNTR